MLIFVNFMASGSGSVSVLPADPDPAEAITSDPEPFLSQEVARSEEGVRMNQEDGGVNLYKAYTRTLQR